MTENEQIQEMAKLACTVFEGRCSECPCKLHSPCAPKASAEQLYNKGYRKVERGEWRPNGYHNLCTKCLKNVARGDPYGFYQDFKFCPNCGADMRGDGE